MIIGIHTPETDEERNAAHVEALVKRLGISWSVLLDPRGENWRRWRQSYWPTIYLVDKRGHARYQWTGELGWNGADGEMQVADAIRRLLAEPESGSGGKGAARGNAN